MTGKPLRLLTSFLLTAIMLTGGSGLPSYCHSHAGGGNPHCHHGHDHAAHEGHDPHASDHLADVNDSKMMEAAVAHVHLLWLGFGLSFPLDSEDDDEDQSAPFLAVGRLLQIATVAPSTTETVLCQQADSGLASFTIVAERQFRRAASQIPALPLCAQARHERSGVQLI